MFKLNAVSGFCVTVVAVCTLMVLNVTGYYLQGHKTFIMFYEITKTLALTC